MRSSGKAGLAGAVLGSVQYGVDNIIIERLARREFRCYNRISQCLCGLQRSSESVN